MGCNVFPAKYWEECNASLMQELNKINLEKQTIQRRVPPSNKKVWILGLIFGEILAIYTIDITYTGFLKWEVNYMKILLSFIVGFAVGAAFGYLYNRNSKQGRNALTAAEREVELAKMDKMGEDARNSTYKRYANYVSEFNKQVESEQLKLRSGSSPEVYAKILLPYLEKYIEKIDRSKGSKNLEAQFTFYVSRQGITIPWKTRDDSYYPFETSGLVNLKSDTQVAAVGRLIANIMRNIYILKKPIDASGTDYFLTYDVEYQMEQMIVKMKYNAPNGFYSKVSGW